MKQFRLQKLIVIKQTNIIIIIITIYITDISSVRLRNIIKYMYGIMNLTFLFLELHMPKVVLFFAMLVCIYDACALYLFIVILIVLSLTTGQRVQIIAIYSSSFFISILLLARMLYQIRFIKPGEWNVTCQVP